MRRKRTRAISSAAVLAAIAAIGTTAAMSTGARGESAAATNPLTSIRVYPDVPHFVPVIIGQTPATDAQCNAVFNIDCYLPTQVEAAYNLPALYSRGITGKGETIVLIDAFGSPTISDDVAQFDDYIGLGVPPLQIVKYGNVPVFDNTNDDMLEWADETTLDVEYAHAGAPDAKIVLVETANDSMSSLAGAVGYATSHHLGQVISMSWGEPEENLGAGEVQSLHRIFAAATAAGITVIAASGDTGVTGADNNNDFYNNDVASWPAVDPLVTAVGGTHLNINVSGQRGGPDSAWNDTYNNSVNDFLYGQDGPYPIASGGGTSAYFSRPSYQNSVRNITGSQRGIPDIAMSASCSAAVNVYESFYGVIGGWSPFCGTSEAAPMLAAVVALADQLAGHSLGAINPAIYKLAAEHAPGIVPITSGNNTVAVSGYTWRGYSTRNGYSLVTGVGSVNGEYFVPELAKLG
jgi:subtilase family serine protease